MQTPATDVPAREQHQNARQERGNVASTFSVSLLLLLLLSSLLCVCVQLAAIMATAGTRVAGVLKALFSITQNYRWYSVEAKCCSFVPLQKCSVATSSDSELSSTKTDTSGSSQLSNLVTPSVVGYANCVCLKIIKLRHSQI